MSQRKPECRNTITNYEAGQTEPSASDLARISGALCMEGERACPLEDSGGVYGYVEFVEALIGMAAA